MKGLPNGRPFLLYEIFKLITNKQKHVTNSDTIEGTPV